MLSGFCKARNDNLAENKLIMLPVNILLIRHVVTNNITLEALHFFENVFVVEYLMQINIYIVVYMADKIVNRMERV